MNKNSTISIFCDKCKTEIVMPIPMPQDKHGQPLLDETIKLLQDKYRYKKPSLISKKMFVKAIHKGFIRFQCPKCKWEKLTKLQEILIQGLINANICRTCDLDVCLWVNCPKGGYIKNDK